MTAGPVVDDRAVYRDVLVQVKTPPAAQTGVVLHLRANGEMVQRVLDPGFKPMRVLLTCRWSWLVGLSQPVSDGRGHGNSWRDLPARITEYVYFRRRDDF